MKLLWWKKKKEIKKFQWDPCPTMEEFEIAVGDKFLIRTNGVTEIIINKVSPSGKFINISWSDNFVSGERSFWEHTKYIRVLEKL